MKGTAPGSSPSESPPMPREIHHTYSDPLDIIWVATAARFGMRVERSDEVYAAWDGRGTMSLSAAAHFDADDSLAQLVFHELCHALCEGPETWGRPDWGLDNFTDRDWIREYGCLRMQAALADAVGLRRFFGATTDFRPYWDALPADPLADDGDPAVPIARVGYARATEGPYAVALREALEATAAVVRATRPYAPPESVFAAPDAVTAASR